MKKILVKIGLFLIGLMMVLSPFGIFLLIANNQPHVYSKTYYAALVDKVHYLKSLKSEKKIVLIGGSNVAFGFNSELLEQEFPEYKVVNFGLYAMLGTKIMMDLAIDYIGEGDMVFIIPEINSQSTSLYFNAESTLKALEDDMDIINKLPKDNKESVVGSYFDFIKDRGKQKTIIEPNGVYQRKNFNKYGDILFLSEEGISKRDKNRMPLHYDPSLLVDYKYKIDNEFFEYVNSYVDSLIKKKATCYYSWSPVDDLSTSNNDDEIDSYYWLVRQKIKANVVGEPSNYIMNNHYFYDSNFHLNDSGATLRTLKLIEDYYRDVLFENKSLINQYPDELEYETLEIDTSVNSKNADDFLYQENGEYLEIVGVANDSSKAIALPSVANHKVVTGINSYSFSGTQIEEIAIPATIKYIKDGAFGNSNVKRIYMVSTHPDETNISWDGGFIKDTIDSFEIFVPSSSLNDYKENYFWGPYKNIIRGY